MKQYTISKLNKNALADRHYLLHSREAEWEDVECQGSVLDTTGLNKLRIVCCNCGCFLERGASCEFIRGALRCPDCGEKYFHVSRMVRRITSATTPAPARSPLPSPVRRPSPVAVTVDSLPPVPSEDYVPECAARVSVDRERESALRAYGYSDDMSPFQVFAFCMTRHYADFGARATRRELWLYLLILIPLVVAAALVDLLVVRYVLFLAVVGVITLLPTLAVLIRRAHDSGQKWSLVSKALGLTAGMGIARIFFGGAAVTGLWVASFFLLICLAAFVTSALFTDSQPGSNEYGPSYKYPKAKR